VQGLGPRGARRRLVVARRQFWLGVLERLPDRGWGADLPAGGGARLRHHPARRDRHDPDDDPRSMTTLAGGRYVKGSQGWTLVELMLTLVIFAIVVFAILTLWQHAQTAYFVGSERAEVQGDARVAIDQMSRDLMKAGRDVLQCAFDSEAYTQCSGAKLARCRSLASLGASFSCGGIYIIPT